MSKTGLRLACAIATLVLGACGGTTSPGVGSGDGGGGTDSGTGADGGTGSDSGGDSGGGAICPATPPASGSMCSPQGLQCEYGTSPDPGCNMLAGCTASGWEYALGGNCTMGQCASSYGSVPVNQNCAGDNGLVCGYAQGTCTCSYGAPPHVNGPVWQCFPAADGCPSPRPDIGTACSDPGKSCDYGACQGGIALQCTGGVWQEQMTACPG
jgi:hypothetical protein